jgi:hypothetical protein
MKKKTNMFNLLTKHVAPLYMATLMNLAMHA